MAQKVTKNVILDYLVMSFKTSYPGVLLDFFLSYFDLKLSDFQIIRSFYGLEHCLFFSGIKLHYSDDAFVFDCSGKGCRAVESLCRGWFDWWTFLSMWDHDLCHKTPNGVYAVKIARMDVACDVLDSSVSVDKCARYIRAGKYVCKSTYYTIIEGNTEHAVYFGSPKSDRRLRIYDKAEEQHIEGAWTRFEFQLRNDNALSFYLNCKANNGDIVRTYYGALHDYLRFTTKQNVPTVGHQSRLQTTKWWRDLIADINKIGQLYLPGNEYDLSSMSRFLRKQCASTIKTFLSLNDGDVSQLLEIVDETKLNRKQRDLIHACALEKLELEELLEIEKPTYRNKDGFFYVTGGEMYEQCEYIFGEAPQARDPRLGGL